MKSENLDKLSILVAVAAVAVAVGIMTLTSRMETTLSAEPVEVIDVPVDTISVQTDSLGRTEVVEEVADTLSFILSEEYVYVAILMSRPSINDLTFEPPSGQLFVIMENIIMSSSGFPGDGITYPL